MSKAALKQAIINEVGNHCAITEEPLPANKSLFDTHRKTPKRKGGDYKHENTVLVIPTAHMEEHGTLRRRQEELEKLKSIVDERNKLMQARIKINNQLLAYQRLTDAPTEEMLDFLNNSVDSFAKEEQKKLRKIEKQLISMQDVYPVVKTALGVKGIGPVTVAYCLVYIKIEEARHASSLWKYVGLHCQSTKRYSKGEAGGGNKTLRTVLYTMGDSQIKTRGPYREVYDNVKFRLEHSEKPVETRNRKGQLETKPWKETMPSHRHGAAIRQIMKHFLADLWYVWRTLEGLPTSPLYPEAILGGNHRTIMPDERGWVY